MRLKVWKRLDKDKDRRILRRKILEVLGSSNGCFAKAKLKFSLEAKLLSPIVACYNSGFLTAETPSRSSNE